MHLQKEYISKERFLKQIMKTKSKNKMNLFTLK